ncbi:MAG: MaoC family dehydratase N-terminal domain-containing protein [Chloroflexi bacterium]|nr:MaoC family dehydratase N-terminal domain-containing protein [Chloroflexota bacterium]MBU1752014.1 MaoC family dehydratase N-terminal domain-containing protein [Chloroflexota bacterium]
MEISSRFVGTPLKEHRTEIAWRDMMNYAAAIDDGNPRYFDDEQPAGIIAHPMFCVAVTWRVLERIWEFIEAHDFPFHLLATQVHYTEHLQFHRPIRPDDVLTIRGQIAAIQPHRAGTYVVIRSEAYGASGEPVFTEHSGTLLRGVKCTDEGQGGDTLPSAPANPDQALIWETTIPIEPWRPHIYDGCTGITFPIHTSRAFAHDVGLPDIILQGTATLAFAVRELIDREAGGDPLLLRALQCRFSRMVVPGTEIRVQLVGRTAAADGTGLHFVVLNQDGRPAVSHGHAFLATEGKHGPA